MSGFVSAKADGHKIGYATAFAVESPLLRQKKGTFVYDKSAFFQ